MGEAVQMLVASGTDGDWRLQRHTREDSPTYSLLPAGTQRDPCAWVLSAAADWPALPWICQPLELNLQCSAAFKGRDEPQVQPGWKPVP